MEAEVEVGGEVAQGGGEPNGGRGAAEQAGRQAGNRVTPAFKIGMTFAQQRGAVRDGSPHQRVWKTGSRSDKR